jgi:hypothetical protein
MEGYDLFSSGRLIYDMFTWRVRLERAWSYDSLSRWERETASTLGSEKYLRAGMKLSDIDQESTNICRCGTYQRMRLAIRRAAAPARG